MIYHLNLTLDLILFFPYLLKLFMIITLSFGIIVLRKYHKNNIITIEKMKVEYFFFFVLNTIIFCSLYVILLLYWRFLNLNKNVDLKLTIYNLYLFLTKNNIWDTSLLLICVIIFLIFLYYIIKILKKYYFFHFLKIHMYIVYLNLDDDFDIRTTYDKIIHKVLKLDKQIYSYTIDKPIYFFSGLYLRGYNFNSANYDREVSAFTALIKNKLSTGKIADKFPIILLLSAFAYDIIYNNMIINKFYIISFCLFFYYLLKKITNVMCFLEQDHSIFMYEYFYLRDKNIFRFTASETIQDQLETYHEINKRLLQADTYGERKFPLGYEDNEIIKLSWSSYLLLINIAMVVQIYIYRNIKITFFEQIFAYGNGAVNGYVVFYQEIIHLSSILFSVIFILISLWFFVRNIIIEQIFLIISTIIMIIWFLITLNHFVPMLFHELLMSNCYYNILDNYTILEKEYFIKEYLTYKMQKLNLNKDYLISILDKIPLKDLIELHDIKSLTTYVDNLIIMFEHLENINTKLETYYNNPLHLNSAEQDKNILIKILSKIKDHISFYFKK